MATATSKGTSSLNGLAEKSAHEEVQKALRTSTCIPHAAENNNIEVRRPLAGRPKPMPPVSDSRVSTLFTDYLTQAAMAEAIGVSERTLTRWHSLRVGPPRTVIGRKILYHIPIARAWIAAQEEEIVHRGRGAV